MMRWKWNVIGLLTVALFIGGCLSVATPEDTQESLVEAGKRIYCEGIGSEGQPVQGLVMGDIPIFGDQFTCLHCHRHSGLGGAEGTKYVMPTSAPALYSPRSGIYHERPAYDDASLAEMLRLGIDPGGNILDSVMPVYELSDADMQALTAYLKTLSNTISPGVDGRYLHIATVVGPQVPEVQSQGMLSVLERFFRDTNGLARRPEILAEVGPFYHEYKNKAYREWKLHVWELKGAPDSWGEQLEAYYRQQPIFAMLSGITAGPWQPIHDFTRRFGIPNILPNTDMPALDADDDFYTLYFSAGLALEAQTILDDVSRHPELTTLVQFSLDETRSSYGAQAMQYLSDLYPEVTLESRRFESLARLAANLSQIEAQTAVMLWLDKGQRTRINPVLQELKGRIYLSSTLLGRDLEVDLGRKKAWIAHPFNLPEDQPLRALRTRAWIRGRKLPQLDDRIQTQTWYACKLFHSGIKHIKVHFYRDYLLDALDHSSRLGPYANNYPRLSFGPDQRYLAKGAYLVMANQKTNGGKTVAEWRTP